MAQTAGLLGLNVSPSLDLIKGSNFIDLTTAPPNAPYFDFFMLILGLVRLSKELEIRKIIFKN